jgi:hypothetical protein
LCLFIAARAIFQLSGGCHHYRWQGCKFLAYARRSGPLSREGSLSCHTYCDTGPRFIRSDPKDWHPRPTVGFEPPTQGSSDHCAGRPNHCATQATNQNSGIHINIWLIYSFQSNQLQSKAEQVPVGRTYIHTCCTTSYKLLKSSCLIYYLGRTESEYYS